MDESELQPVSSITMTMPCPAKDLPKFRTPTNTTNDLVMVATNPSTAQDQELDNNSIRHRKLKRILALVALETSLLLTSLDMTIVSTCLPRIGSDFNEYTIAAWVANSYIICFDSFQPLFSKLNDIFGRKWTLITGLGAVMIGSLLCGVATNIIMLIICRAITGIGSAAILSSVAVIVYEMAPVEKRGIYQGCMNSVYPLAAVVGPFIGGSFTDHLTWRWCFYINLPIGAVVILILIFYLDIPVPETKLVEKLKRIDYVGTLLTLVISILFLISLNFGETYSWNSPMVLVPLILSIALIGVLVLVECKFAWDPILPPHLFKNRSVLAIIGVNWWSGQHYLALIYYLPLYCQVILGDTAMWSGIRLIPSEITTALGGATAGYLISRTKSYRPFLWMGASISTIGIGLYSIFGVDTQFGMIYGFTMIYGLGSGFLFSSTILTLQASVAPQDISVVIGLGDFARLLGGAVGISVSSTALNSRLSKNLPNVVPLEYVEAITRSSQFVRNGLPEQYLSLVLKVYAESIRVIFYIMTPMAVLSLVASFWVEKYDIFKPGEKISKLSASNGSQEPKYELPKDNGSI